MRLKPIAIPLAVLAAALNVPAAPTTAPVGSAVERDLESGFTKTVQPFVEQYCLDCHTGKKAEAQFDLSKFKTLADVALDHPHWATVIEKLESKEMPPPKEVEKDKLPPDEARKAVIDWIKAMRHSEAKKHAGDPGIVLARRLSNAEYNYTIRDLVGHDLRPTREFPVDPANPAGFDNSGESLAMSPALLTKYLQAAREVANHMVLRLDRIDFAPHPMLVETDRDKFCVGNIIDFYRRQNIDYGDYFRAAWRYKHRAALGKPDATLADVAKAGNVSAKYLNTVWTFLETDDDDVGPVAKLRTMWRELPAPQGNQLDDAKAGCDAMRDWVVTFRAKVEPRFMNLEAGRIRANSQPMLMWKNRMYATHRMSFERDALQVQGEERPVATRPTTSEAGADNEFGPGRTQLIKNMPGDPDLVVPAGQRERYEKAFARFCAVFPDMFYMAERGRNYLDKSKDRGRYLSAGFHNVMGYFRDDQPLYELVLDASQQKELDALWKELDYIASGNIRTHIQFYFNESGEARGTSRESEGPRPKDLDVISERMVKQLEQTYIDRAKTTGGDSPIAIQALEDHFRIVNDGLRWVENARTETQPLHLESLLKFATRAYRRPLTNAEREDLLAFYKMLREESKLEHEDAMRDLVVSVLMSPDFCYRIDLVQQAGSEIQSLSDYALASRLSYFLWSSMPDDELLRAAAAGELRKPDLLAAQARRMLKDEKILGLATEFGGHWLDFRRFEELNTVDRERFASFDDPLRTAMFEEPIQFMLDVFRENRPVLDFLYANHTFVNAPLAKHYGMPQLDGDLARWVRVDDANQYGRGGVLPMGVFLTQNAPGLRTSPVKRGYWVVKRVLGEHIPAPPAVVPELPRDEAKTDAPLRDVLAKHREDQSCASCHARFDSLGLVFEGYGPIGERREKDLAGRPIDATAKFPNGAEGNGFDGLRQYVREHRQDDFVNGLSRSLLAYALGRSLVLSDELLVDEMRERLAKNDYRFDTLIETIVTSPQFRTKRGSGQLAQR